LVDWWIGELMDWRIFVGVNLERREARRGSPRQIHQFTNSPIHQFEKWRIMTAFSDSLLCGVSERCLALSWKRWQAPFSAVFGSLDASLNGII